MSQQLEFRADGLDHGPTFIEEAMARILDKMGLAYYEQVEHRTPCGQYTKPDFVLSPRSLRLFLYCDSGYHLDHVTAQTDRRIDRALRRGGIEPMRFWRDEILYSQARVQREIAAAIAVRGGWPVPMNDNEYRRAVVHANGDEF